MPPDCRLILTPSPRRRLEAPSKVSEFGLTDAATARLPTAESRTLLLTVTLALYSLGLRGRTRRLLSGRPAVVALTVANEVPSPVSVLSAKAHGKMPLFCVPETPPWPLKVAPPAKKTLVAPGESEKPKLKPRKRTEAPRVSVLAAVVFCAGAMLSGAPQKIRFILPAALSSRLMVEAPRAKVGLPMFSVTLSVMVRLPRTRSSPPRKPTSLALALLTESRPLAVGCGAGETRLKLRSSSQRDESLSM